MLSVCSGWLCSCGHGSLTETRIRTTHPLTNIRLCLYCVPWNTAHECRLSARAYQHFGSCLGYAQSSGLNYIFFFCCQREDHRHEVAARNRTKGLLQCDREESFCYTLGLCIRLHAACPLNAEWAGLLQRLHALFIFRLQLSLPLVALSACGWLLFVVGFAAVNLRNN